MGSSVSWSHFCFLGISNIFRFDFTQRAWTAFHLSLFYFFVLSPHTHTPFLSGMCYSIWFAPIYMYHTLSISLVRWDITDFIRVRVSNSTTWVIYYLVYSLSVQIHVCKRSRNPEIVYTKWNVINLFGVWIYHIPHMYFSTIHVEIFCQEIKAFGERKTIKRSAVQSDTWRSINDKCSNKNFI